MTQFILKIILFLYLYGISSSSFRFTRFETIKNISYNNSIPAKEEIIGGQWHPCYRNCDDKIKRTCKYTFVLKQYTSMSYACHDCPFNKEDCFLNGCITAGGHVRPVTVANHMLPGPSIQVCISSFNLFNFFFLVFNYFKCFIFIFLILKIDLN